MTERAWALCNAKNEAWALCNAKNEREYDRLVRQFYREDVEKNWKPMREYSAEEMFGSN